MYCIARSEVTWVTRTLGIQGLKLYGIDFSGLSSIGVYWTYVDLGG